LDRLVSWFQPCLEQSLEIVSRQLIP
jgi:hypothetical protein